ncbi:MAG TPA: glycoside hydrolase family 3 N-terminal domain-containing protein, partial [Rhabdochlamydiaceae bacterium]|nr:glycoside hydrolase family 3 N-terminal domain-containing protein [Rhabdochlamydiaceae bacterium]
LSQVKLIQKLQQEARVPLLCVQDAESGLSARLTETIKFPENLTLGAIQDDTLIYQLGKEVGRSCKKVGAHLNLSPVVDVNNNPKNPIIHMRSYGEDPENVARKAVAYAGGLASEGILAAAKHFPGHGDTEIDSHYALPLIPHTLDHLSKVELVPFAAAIQANIPCILTAHLALPALEPNLPATFSSKIVTDLLKKQMGFQGVVISDALNMQALTNEYTAEEIGLKALLAGHDLLLYGDHIAPNIRRILIQDLPAAFARIKKAVLDGTLPEKELNARVEKILDLKKKCSFDLATENLLEELNREEAKQLKRVLYRNAITLVKDPQKNLPLKEGSDAVIVALYEKPSQECIAWIQKMQEYQPVVVVLFQSPYTLLDCDINTTLIMAYENDPDMEEAATDLIFGKLIPKGKLPISLH